MSGAGGLPKPKHFKRTMKVSVGLSLAQAAAEMEDNDLPPQPPAAAAPPTIRSSPRPTSGCIWSTKNHFILWTRISD